MTQAVAHILDEFEHLSGAERSQLRQPILARVPMTNDLAADDFAALTAASFRTLDQEEDARRA